MNENIDLKKILKDCPKGTRLYTSVWGVVTFIEVMEDYTYSIGIETPKGRINLTKEGCYTAKEEDAECILFPSKNQRDWSKFSATWHKEKKFNPKTLEPFDKILVKRYDDVWVATLLSYYCNIIHPEEINIQYLEFITISNGVYRRCIPYNNDTKHLVGTKDEAPEYYRYWEN